MQCWIMVDHGRIIVFALFSWSVLNAYDGIFNGHVCELWSRYVVICWIINMHSLRGWYLLQCIGCRFSEHLC